MDIVATGFRIKQAIGLTGYNVKEFCERTHRSRVTTALWIAGRGGVIKEANIEELCTDLLCCNVACDAEWIYSGKGPSPTLIDHEQVKFEHKSINESFKYLDKNLLGLLKKYNRDELIEYNDKSIYSIGVKQSIKDIRVGEKDFYQIWLKSGEVYVGNVISLCDEVTTVVIKDRTMRIFCVLFENIKIVTYNFFFFFK